VATIWQILVEFLFRLTLGVGVAMGVTSPRLVTSGFYRVHLWVLMGVNTLAALAVFSGRATPAYAGQEVAWREQLIAAIAAAVLSYVGAVIWMYEGRTSGKVALWFVVVCALVALAAAPEVGGSQTVGERAFRLADQVTSGLLMGFMTAAMLLGHWYLNTPTMQLEPLKRLIALLAVAIVLRMAVSGFGTALLFQAVAVEGAAVSLPPLWGPFLALRWLAGLLGTLVMAGMTWQTLKVPNTQSATGILYAGMILAFIGELTAALLSAESPFPL
jgi:hypothetical protein